MKKAVIILSILAMLAFWQNTIAQTLRNTQSSVDNGSRNNLTVDPITNALQLQIPLGAFPQRNGGLPVSLSYSSKLWHIGDPRRWECLPGTDTNDRYFANYAKDTKAGWTSSLGFPYIAHSFETYNNQKQPTTTGFTSRVARLMLVMPGGSRHELRKDDQIYPANATFSGKFYATDGSRIIYDKDTGTLYLPDGSRFEGVAQVIGGSGEWIEGVFKDANGNQTTYGNNQVTDSLGRVITKPLNPSFATGDQNGAAAADVAYALPGLDGQPINYQMRWRKLSAAGVVSEHETAQTLKYKGDWTGSSCGFFTGGASDALFFSNLIPSGNEQMNRTVIFDPVVLHQIELPNGQIYTFKYNIYGEITKIIYPTGGYERFEYEQVSGISGWTDYTIHQQANRGVVRRWVSVDGSSQSEQIYSYTATQSNSRSVVYPDETRSEYLIYAKPQEGLAYGFDNPLYGKVYEERQYAAGVGGALLRRNLTGWTVDGNVVAYQPTLIAYKTRNPRVTKEIAITFEPGSASALAQMTETVYDTHPDAEYFATLNAKQRKTYHYAVLDLATAQNSNIEQIATLFSNSNLATISEIDYLYDTNYKVRNITVLPTETRLKDASGNITAKSQISYDEPAYPLINSGTVSNWQDPNTNYRGNATTARTWVQETNSWIETHAQFDNFGNLRKQWDSSGDANRFVETEYSSQYNFAYPTRIIAPPPDPTGVRGTNMTSEITRSYDFTTGLTLSVTDVNGQTTNFEYDAVLRPRRVIPPAGGAITEKEYGVPDASGQYPANQRFVKVKQQIDQINWAESTTWFDGLGRTIKTQSEDAQGDVFAEIEYDDFGRVKQVSNPYRQGEQKLWSKPRYDIAGRVVEGYAPASDGQTGASLGTVEFGISTVSGFVGTYITGTDASGRKARSITNGLGQIIRVDEPTGNNDLGSLASPNLPTFNIYNARGELVKVQQGQQNRFFMYDSLGRLIRVRQPEQNVNPNLNTSGNPENNSWTAGFSYDVFDNVIRVTDGKGINVINEYDRAGRAIVRCYTKPNVQTVAVLCSQVSGSDVSVDTPRVDYFYDGKGLEQTPQFARGNLTTVSSSVSENRYTSFDNFGRMLVSQQITDGQTYNFGYKYNLSGGLIEETYPSGRVVKNHVGSDGGLTAVSSKVANGQYRNYASNFDYSAAGGVKSMMLGNGRWETAQFNTRLQLTQIGLGTSVADTSLWKANYEYGELNADGTVDATKNTGSVAKHTVTLPSTSFVQTYKYDELNRLTEAKETTSETQNWKQTFGYDRFGNRTTFSQIIGSQQLVLNNINHPAIDPATNRFTTGQGYVYDLNGNLVQDAEGRTFTFNGDDKQIEVKNASQQPIGTYYYDGDGARVKKVTNTETTIFVYDGGGDLVAEYSTAAPVSNPTTSYLTTDNLGSPRVITDKLGNVISRRDFMPFGQELGAGIGTRTESLKYSITGADNVRQRFTSYEKDSETQLDFAEARMYENRHGRFTAVDPLLSSASLDNPQTFNRYIYTGNNPINYTDPDGLDYYQDVYGNVSYYPGSQKRKGLTNITGQSGTITRGGCVNGQCFNTGDYVNYGSNSITLVDPATLTPAQVAQITRGTNADVRATEQLILNNTDSAGLSPELLSTRQSGQRDFLPPIPSPDPDDNLGRDLLEGFSLLPVVGTPFDVALAVIDVSEGNYTSTVISIVGILPYGDALKIVKKGKKLADAVNTAKKTAKEGIYEFPDAIEVGKTYIGQSGNIPSRLSQHKKTGKLNPKSKVKTKTVKGGKTKREIAEQGRIDQLGGTRKNPGSKTSNKVNPIGKSRRKKLGLE